MTDYERLAVLAVALLVWGPMVWTILRGKV